MCNSTIITFGLSLGLAVKAAEVQEINSIIFATKVNAHSFGDVVSIDGVPHLIDVKANTSDILTPATIVEAAKAGLVADKPSAFQEVAVSTSEAFGAVTSVTFTKDGGVSCPQSIKAFAKATGMKVIDVTIAVQNDVIFSTKGIPSISGLTEKDGEFYQIDLVANTATIVNAAALSAQAKTDILADKETDATRFVSSFGLIQELVFSKTAGTPEAIVAPKAKAKAKAK